MALVAALVVQREELNPFGGTFEAAAAAELSSTVTAREADAQLYVTAVAPEIVRRYAAVEVAVSAIDTDPTADGPARADRVEREVLPPLRALLADATAYPARSRDVAAAHRSSVAALRASVRAFEAFAAAFAVGDLGAIADAQGRPPARAEALAGVAVAPGRARRGARASAVRADRTL